MGFMTGRKIYDNFTNGTGPDGLSSGAAIVNEVAAGYGERAEAIRRIAAKMEAAWQGEAAGAARRGVGPLEVEHALAGMDLATAQDLTNRQAGSFADARNAVVPVPSEPTKPDPWAVFRSPGDVVTYQQQVAEYNAASQHNVDVMTGYAGASSFNAKGLPQSFGSLTNDQAGIAIDSGTPPSDRGDDTSRRVAGRVAPKSDGGPRSQPAVSRRTPASRSGRAESARPSRPVRVASPRRRAGRCRSVAAVHRACQWAVGGEEDDVRNFAAAAEQIAEEAMSPERSAEVIEQLVNGMETT